MRFDLQSELPPQAARYRVGNDRIEEISMSEPTPTTPRSKTDSLWRTIIIAIFVIGVVAPVALLLLNGNWASVFSTVPVFAFGILIAAIRSIRCQH